MLSILGIARFGIGVDRDLYRSGNSALGLVPIAWRDASEPRRRIRSWWNIGIRMVGVFGAPTVKSRPLI
jgi:hypothetical protein